MGPYSSVWQASQAQAKEASQSGKKAPCDWEQWFTPDSLEMYYYNTKTGNILYSYAEGAGAAKQNSCLVQARHVEVFELNGGRAYTLGRWSAVRDGTLSVLLAKDS